MVEIFTSNLIAKNGQVKKKGFQKPRANRPILDLKNQTKLQGQAFYDI